MSSHTERRHRLLLGGLVVVLVSVLLIVVLTGRGVREGHVQAAQQSLAGHADVVALALDDRHAAVATLAEVWSRDDRLRDAVSGGDLEVLDRLLAALDDANAYVDGAFVADPEGVLIAATAPDQDLVGLDFSDRDWFRGAVDRGGPYVAEVVRSRSVGNPLTMGIGTPIVDDGRTLGVLVTRSLIDEVQVFAEEVLRDLGAEVTVVDRRGQIVARTSAPPTDVTVLDDRRVIRPDATVFASVSGNDDGILWAAAPLERSGGAVLLERSEAELFGAADRGRQRTLAGTGLLALLALFVGLWLVRSDRDRHRALRHAAERDAFLSGLLATVNVGVAVTDTAGRTIYANEAHRRTPADTVTVQRVLDGEETVSVTLQIDGVSDAPDRWVQVDGAALRGTDGELVGVVQVTSDVTAAQEREAVLRRSERWAHVLLEATPVPLAVVDGEQCVTSVNEAFVELFDRDRAELVGHDLTALVEEGRREGEPAVDGQRAGRVLRRDGHERFVRLELRPVSDLDDRAVSLVVVHDVTASRAEVARLERQAETDPLTRLVNRAGLLRQAGQLLARPGPGRPAVLYLDLDGFKAVNDRNGHAVGDRLLVEVADGLRAALRDDDLIARVGGDEFVVLARSLDREALTHLEQRLRDVVATAPLSERYEVTASVGHAILGIDGDDLEALLQVADARMYGHKARGDRMARV